MVQKALAAERQHLRRSEEFPCKQTRKLNDDVAFKFMPGSWSSGTWSRQGSWMQKFFAFAQGVCRQSQKYRTRDQCTASPVMCRHFLVHVAGEKKGITRPRSARAALSKYRISRGWTSLTGDQAIAAIVRSAEAAESRTKKQSAGLTSAMVKFVVKKWGSSRSWWKRQCSTMMALGFVSLMRLGEIRSLQRAGVRVTFRDGREADVQEMDILPDPRYVSGMLLHLPWRKNHVAQDCWVTVACQTSIALILRQVRTLRHAACKNKSLFPSRVCRAGGRHIMNPTNWIGEDAWVSAMQKALSECVPCMTPDWVQLYTGHALRMGGSNNMRKLGVADDIHRRLGGWMSLTSAQGYMALTAQEQYAYTAKLVREKERRIGLSKGAARAALTLLRSLHL